MPPRRKRGGARKTAATPRTRARAPAAAPVDEEVVLGEEVEVAMAVVADAGIVADAVPGEVEEKVGEGEVVEVEGRDGEGDDVVQGKEAEVEAEEEEHPEELEEVGEGGGENNSQAVVGEGLVGGDDVEEVEEVMGEEKDGVLESGMDAFVQEEEDEEEPEEILDEEIEEEKTDQDQDEMEIEEVLEKQHVSHDGEGIQMYEGDDPKNRSDVGEDSEDNDEEVDPSAFMDLPISERKKQKEFEIFVGGLDREAVEEDLTKVFGVFGEIQTARIVKNPTTQKSKGYAFIRFATVEQAKKALDELKDGVEVRGKKVGISAGQDNDTLYVGNICKTWSKERVLEKMKGYGVESIEEIYLPEDPKSEGKHRGFALLEFSSHSDAMAAFKQLKKPDAAFGCDRSAKVAFAQTSMHPSEESLSQVKTVYIDGLPDSWDEEKVKEYVQQYGQIEKIQLSKNFTVARRKDFGFVSFSSRECAVACVEGINSSEIGEGDKKVKANLAKPQNKGRLAKQGARGGFRVKKDIKEEDQSGKMKIAAKSKSVEAKGSGRGSFRGGRGGRGGQSSNPHFKATGGRGGSRFQDRPRGEHRFRGGKVAGGGGDHVSEFHPKPSKESRGKAIQERQRREQQFRGGKHGSRGRGRVPEINMRSSKKYHGNIRGKPSNDPYASPALSTGYRGRGYGPGPGSKRQYSDMEPHSGYLGRPAKQGRDSFGYGRAISNAYDRSGAYDDHASIGSGYAGSVGQPSYSAGYSGYPGYEAGFSYPSGGHAYASHAGVYPSHNVAYPSSSGTYPPSGGTYSTGSGAYPPSGAYSSTPGAYHPGGGSYPPHRAYYHR